MRNLKNLKEEGVPSNLPGEGRWAINRDVQVIRESQGVGGRHGMSEYRKGRIKYMGVGGVQACLLCQGLKSG